MNECCNGDVANAEVYDETIVVHMIASEGLGMACFIKTDDGRVHGATSDLDQVTCGTCKIKWLEYVVSQLERNLEKYKGVTEDYQSEVRRLTAERNRLRHSLSYYQGRRY
jgi:hypothetical protein